MNNGNTNYPVIFELETSNEHPDAGSGDWMLCASS